MSAFEEEGAYCFANVGRSVGWSVRPSISPSISRPNRFRLYHENYLSQSFRISHADWAWREYDMYKFWVN